MQKSKEGDNPHARKKISADIFQSLLEATASVDDPNPLQVNWSISNNRMLFFRQDLVKPLFELYSSHNPKKVLRKSISYYLQEFIVNSRN